MADSDFVPASLHFPRHHLARPHGGLRSGRGCAAGRGDGAAVWPAVPTVAGSPVLLRPAGPQDLRAARAMHGRCSGRTLARRYHGPAQEADGYLPHLLDPRFGRSLVASTPAGDVVGLGHLLPDGAAEAEVALLVEDAWQRRGIGRALLRSLLALAVAQRHEEVYVVTQPSNTAMIAVVHGTGLPVAHRADADELVLTARLTASPTAPALSAPAGG